MTVVSKGKYYTYTNTKKLGEVLMEIMFQEVSDFCKIDIQQNWTTQAHQQVCMLSSVLSSYNYIMMVIIITIIKCNQIYIHCARVGKR